MVSAQFSFAKFDRSRRQLSNDTKIVKFGQNLVQKFLISQILWVLGCGFPYSHLRVLHAFLVGQNPSHHPTKILQTAASAPCNFGFEILVQRSEHGCGSASENIVYPTVA